MIFVNTLLLGISSSIDAFGIGITYGVKEEKLSRIIKLIMSIVSLLVTLFSGIIGKILKMFFPIKVYDILGEIILIIIGLYIIIKSFSSKEENNLFFGNFNNLSIKKAIILSLMLSIDSFCIGVGVSAMGINIIFFSILVAILQHSLLNFGLFLGTHLFKSKTVSQDGLTLISGGLLIFIGIIKLAI